MITTHELGAGCGIAGSLTEAALSLRAVGDFPEATAIARPLTAADAAELALPPATRGVEVKLTSSGGEEYVGYSERGDSGAYPVLLWPTGRSCKLLAAPTDAVAFPAPGGGQASGYHPAARLLLVTGGRDAASFGALSFDTGRGELRVLDDTEPLEGRAFATVTAFGTHLLVAGGEDPLNSSESGGVYSPIRTAESFDPRSGRFTAKAIELRVARTRHGATVLPDGDTLLVGGRGPFGTALSALEVVSPANGRSSIARLAPLRFPRLFPAVLPLDDGRLLIAGGTAADGSPLSAFEWLSSNAERSLLSVLPAEVPARHDRAFVALAGGGALGVGGCLPADVEEASASCAVCRAGCPPEAYDAWWILPDGAFRALTFDIVAPRPVLFADSAGRPLLSTGDDADRRLYRFDPWTARFVPDPVLGEWEPEALPRAGRFAHAFEDQAALWLSEGTDEGPTLAGLRHGMRARYAAEGGSAIPYLVPDRPPFDAAGAPSATLAETLWFAPNSDVAAYFPGTDYADFELEIDVTSGFPPAVVVGASRYTLTEVPAGAGTLVVRRAGRALTLQDPSTEAGEAPVFTTAPGRVRVGIAPAHPGAELTIRGVRLVRTPN